MKNIFLLVFISLSSNLVFAQDFKADVKKMHHAYLNVTSFVGKMNVKVYVNNKITTTKNAIVNKHHNQFLYTFDGTTMLVNNDYVLMVDKNESVMVMDQIPENAFEEKIELSQLMFENLDTLLKAYQDWDFLGEKNGQKTYLVHLPNQARGIKRVELSLDKKNFTINKLVYHYDDESTSKNRVIIRFDEVNLHPKFSKTFFSEKKFVKKINDEWTPSPSYENYEFVLADNNQ